MTETRALLITDVVDSTRLSERLGDAAMADVWAAHDRAARDLLPTWHGREIDKTDGMLLMFESAADAVGYALDYHRAVAALPVAMQARAGLHVGPVLLRENTAADVARGAKPIEVDGLAKPTAARVMSLALGGQTLLTPDARAAVGVGARWRFESHGHWLLKGVSEPVELFEVGDDDCRFGAPADAEKAYRVVRVDDRWVPATALPNNLPQPTTSFVGREREIDGIKPLLRSSRLLTLLGMGGLGKTRLSLQVGAEVMREHPDGVWFVELAAVRDAALVVAEVAQVLGVREEPGQPLLQAVCAHLKPLRVLLIVDNCEHVVAACARTIDAIVRAAPGVRVLASSREALRVPGEQTYPVLPLPLPGSRDGVDALRRSTAVRLFVDRARLHKPSFELDEQQAGPVAELVARLEGIPLAIELAAARVRMLGVADINARLKDRYKLLTGGGRVLMERQQTLRALVDWSYDLLGDDEKTVLGRLAAFAGGFDLEAAEAVCGADPIDAFDVVDLVGSLCEKSLVMLDETGASPRYRMLETIREYAREKLGAGGDANANAARHCQHYFAFSKSANVGLRGPEQPRWIARFETELDNVRGAFATALAGLVDPFVAVKLAVAMQSFWIQRGYVAEGRSLVAAAIALPAVQASELAQAWALYVAAALAESQSDHAEARRMLEHCLELRRRVGKPVEIAATLSTLSLVRLSLGDIDAARDGETEALAIFVAADDRVCEAVCRVHLGQVERHAGAVDVAASHLQRGLAIATAVGHREIEAECELTLGAIAVESGDLAEARRRFDRSLRVARDAGDRRGEANAGWWIGRCDLDAGDVDAAVPRLVAALHAFRDFEMPGELVGCLEDLSAVAWALDRHALAVSLLAAVEAARTRFGLLRLPRDAARHEAQAAELRSTIADADHGRAWTDGAGWQTGDAIAAAATLSTG